MLILCLHGRTIIEILFLKSKFLYIRLKASKKLAEEADLKEVQTNINLIKPKPGIYVAIITQQCDQNNGTFQSPHCDWMHCYA